MMSQEYSAAYVDAMKAVGATHANAVDFWEEMVKVMSDGALEYAVEARVYDQWVEICRAELERRVWWV